jgi:hypothetical protein
MASILDRIRSGRRTKIMTVSQTWQEDEITHANEPRMTKTVYDFQGGTGMTKEKA